VLRAEEVTKVLRRRCAVGVRGVLGKIAKRPTLGRGMERLASELEDATRHGDPVWAGRRFEAAELAALLYPGHQPPDVMQRARSVFGADKLLTVSDVRRVLSQLDRQFYPSPFNVRFGVEDIARVELDGMILVLDREDYSVSSKIIKERRYEPHLTAVFRRWCRPGMTVVDVGANVGYYSMLAAGLVGTTGHVMAVEPYSENCRLILLSTAANGFENVELLPVAADSRAGWSYFSTHLGSNGGLQPGSVEDLSDGRGMVVPAFQLDQLVSRHVDFMKLDVEGAEGRVVKGARRIIGEDFPVITTELSREMLGRVSGISAEEYLAGFAALGYQINLIDRSSRELQRFSSPDELLAGWSDPLQIEDLLLIPPDAR
jgi:FkbM family methyltransferase